METTWVKNYFKSRGMMYEGALGLDQTNLASITLGFNRGRIVTFKLRQQIDLDDLYGQEHFEIERKAGTEVHVIACKIRGVRNLATRPSSLARPTTLNMQENFSFYVRHACKTLNLMDVFLFNTHLQWA